MYGSGSTSFVMNEKGCSWMEVIHDDVGNDMINGDVNGDLRISSTIFQIPFYKMMKHGSCLTHFEGHCLFLKINSTIPKKHFLFLEVSFRIIHKDDNTYGYCLIICGIFN
jgi:hypothetical protein